MKIVTMAAAMMLAAGVSNAATYKAEFTAILSPDDTSYPSHDLDLKYLFQSDMPINDISFAESKSNKWQDEHTYFAIKTNDSGVSFASYQYFEDYSENDWTISGTYARYFKVDGNIYTGTGEWTVSEVPLPASVMALLFGLGALRMASRRRQGSA